MTHDESRREAVLLLWRETVLAYAARGTDARTAVVSADDVAGAFAERIGIADGGDGDGGVARPVFAVPSRRNATQ